MRTNSQTRLSETFLPEYQKREIKNDPVRLLFKKKKKISVGYLNCRSFVYAECLLNICQQYLFSLFILEMLNINITLYIRLI